MKRHMLKKHDDFVYMDYLFRELCFARHDHVTRSALEIQYMTLLDRNRGHLQYPLYEEKFRMYEFLMKEGRSLPSIAIH